MQPNQVDMDSKMAEGGHDEDEDAPRPLPRVLSVQSHVVSGYVGNRAAVFPLQLLGFDVDFVNSVQFSNHTKYKTVKGIALSGEHLSDLTDGLESNGLLCYDYLLTGYIGTESFLRSVLDLLDRMMTWNPQLRYICDPVLGDEGKCYVPASLVEIYRTSVVSRAYMITPNQFEAELLSGIKIASEADVVKAVGKLLDLGPKVVVLTSAELEACPGQLCCYAAVASGSTPDGREVAMSKIVVRKQNAYFTGSGDCASALMLAWTHLLTEANLGAALLNTIAAIQSIICLIAKKQRKVAVFSAPQDDRDEKLLRTAEFCVVEGRRFIESPPVSAFSLEQWSVIVPREDLSL